MTKAEAEAVRVKWKQRPDRTPYEHLKEVDRGNWPDLSDLQLRRTGKANESN